RARRRALLQRRVEHAAAVVHLPGDRLLAVGRRPGRAPPRFARGGRGLPGLGRHRVAARVRDVRRERGPHPAGDDHAGERGGDQHRLRLHLRARLHRRQPGPALELPVGGVRGRQRERGAHERAPARRGRPEVPMAAGHGGLPRDPHGCHVRFPVRLPDRVLMAGLPRRQSGQVLVLVAVAILALVGITALALLAGSAAWQRNQLQALADSAALDAALKVGIGCSAAGASTVITEADNFVATQRTRTGALTIAGGTCATPYHGTDTFAGGLSADYYWPYAAHQEQLEVVLTLSLPISFGGAVGRSTTSVTRYAVAQALPASVPAVTATSIACTGGQVNVAGDVYASGAITLSGGCALYAHQRAAGSAYSSFGDDRDYTDGQAWTVAGGACVAGANSGSAGAICSDGYSIAGHATPTCAGATDYLSAGNLAVNPDPCAAGVGRVPVQPVPTALPPDPNGDPAAIATLQGTGGAACSAAGSYGNIVAGGFTWGTGLAPAPTQDAQGYWHFKPSCYGYLNLAAATGAGTISLRQAGPESATATHFLVATLPAPSIAGTLLVATINSDPSPNRATAPAGWLSAASITQAGEGRNDIFYYPNNPGGISAQ